MSAIASFEEFNLNRQLLNAISDLGFERPTEIQQRAIPIITGGQEVIGIAQTGTGKTAAYLLPLLMKVKYAQGTDPRAVILVPTKELTLQIAEHAKELAKYTDLRILPLYGGVGPKAQSEAIKAGVDILVTTPGRFTELYLRGEIPTKLIKTLVLDEADRMMDMGFMPQLRKIFEVVPRKRQNLLFSATFGERVERLSAEFLEFPDKDRDHAAGYNRQAGGAGAVPCSQRTDQDQLSGVPAASPPRHLYPGYGLYAYKGSSR